MCIFFFFSSRRRHTRCSRDWSSDVCSSDLIRSWVSYNNISPHLRNAVLIAEDSAFFQHPGYDLEQIKESAKRNWREKRFARGASTITEQLAKNLYLSTSKNPLRKVPEFFIAREIEEHLSKQRIFEIYLNVIEWG